MKRLTSSFLRPCRQRWQVILLVINRNCQRLQKKPGFLAMIDAVLSKIVHAGRLVPSANGAKEPSLRVIPMSVGGRARNSDRLAASSIVNRQKKRSVTSSAAAGRSLCKENVVANGGLLAPKNCAFVRKSAILHADASAKTTNP
jgi:hypothetical protein